MNAPADSYTAQFTVDRPPEEVFAAVIDVRAWWNENLTGSSARVGDEFSFTDQGILSSRIRLTEVVPGRRVAWRVVDAYLGFVDDHDEWTGTTVTFEITPTADGTTLRFTHHGLTPASACYRDCSRGWDFYLNTSLPELITTGTGQPIPQEPAAGLPTAVDRDTFQPALDELRIREKAHTREGDTIAAARRRLPMVEVDAGLELIGPEGPATLLDAFEGRRQLIAYYFMWNPGRPAAEQCEGCTWCASQVAELCYLHSRDITYAVICQGPYDEGAAYHATMGWEMPWYSAQASLGTLLVGRHVGMMHIVCYLRDGDRVFETYWTTRRGVETMDYSYALMELTVYGRQEPWEVSPAGWPQPWTGTSERLSVDGRPIAQWSRLESARG